MPDSSDFPPVAYMQSEISSTLNSIVLMTFGMGIYTMVYFGTLYIYLTRKTRSERSIVVIAITVLYGLSLLELISQWWSLGFSFVQNDQTQETIFLSFGNLPLWDGLVLNIGGFLAIIVADALLLWRCFQVWGNSVRVIAFPSFLWVAETAIFFGQIIGQNLSENSHSNLSPKAAVLYDNLEAAAFFISAINSILISFLIAYRIYSVSSSPSHVSKSTGRFNYVIDIVLQSAAAYSLSLLVNAITAVIPPTVSGTRLTALILYSTAVTVPIIGIAPTVMVARVALAASQNTSHGSTTVHFSGLLFNEVGPADSETGLGIRTDNSHVAEERITHEKENQDTS
ncbi:hypothetical protein GALMADRAFT_144743 [Galerina marginata CBS 339.88]|uniref:Uncharacterized protein n=1 Tax=Galerina marginata (strain CBS 339.88) TaxID=685588 RepID=A0A067SKF1_GALM3|nr:hypothetical protein GALMADRAFT_144743 [Galerina marginata CBS 339.88]